MADRGRRAEPVDANIDDLLDGLEGTARTERAELVEWLLEQGITAEEIRATDPPLLLATRHLIGDDGTYVSTREISERHGIDLELLQRVQRAIGLARVDDPDAAIHMRADGEAAAYAQRFVELGLTPDQVVLVVRVLAEGLSHAAEVMRYTALAAIMRPGATELQIAQGVEGAGQPDRTAARPDDSGHAVHAAATHDGDRGGQCRRAGRRQAAAGRAPGHRRFRRPRRVHQAG